MRFKSRAMIFLAAVLVTFLGFNLLASPAALEMMKQGKKCEYKIVSQDLVKLTDNYVITVTG